MRTLAGIDGGGTRTRLTLVRENGELLGFAETGCASFVELGVEGAKSALATLWQRGWQAAGAEPTPADALFIGTGSILSEQDERTICRMAIELGLSANGLVRAGNDALNALAGGLCGRPGILLIAGTGSACFGRNERGETWRAGGWGHLLADLGSAYALGLAAIIAATRESDGRGPATTLTPLVREALSLGDLREVYRKLHHDGVSRAEIAALARSVVVRAGEGDGVAQELLRQGAAGLVEMVVTVARKLRLERPELALTGGLISNASAFRQMFLQQLNAALHGCTLATDGLPPVLGAVLLASQMLAGKPPEAQFVANLRHAAASLPVTE